MSFKKKKNHYEAQTNNKKMFPFFILVLADRNINNMSTK